MPAEPRPLQLSTPPSVVPGEVYSKPGFHSAPACVFVTDDAASETLMPSKYSAPPKPALGPMIAQTTRPEIDPDQGARFVTENFTHVFEAELAVKWRLSTAETKFDPL